MGCYETKINKYNEYAKNLIEKYISDDVEVTLNTGQYQNKFYNKIYDNY